MLAATVIQSKYRETEDVRALFQMLSEKGVDFHMRDGEGRSMFMVLSPQNISKLLDLGISVPFDERDALIEDLKVISLFKTEMEGIDINALIGKIIGEEGPLLFSLEESPRVPFLPPEVKARIIGHRRGLTPQEIEGLIQTAKEEKE